MIVTDDTKLRAMQNTVNRLLEETLSFMFLLTGKSESFFVPISEAALAVISSTFAGFAATFLRLWDISHAIVSSNTFTWASASTALVEIELKR